MHDKELAALLAETRALLAKLAELDAQVAALLKR
jgi:hypothetical protein